MQSTLTAEVAVIGAGPAGLVSAIALAAAGVETLLIAPPAVADHRTTALLAGSVTPALAIESDASAVTIRHANGVARVRLAIGADGAHSMCRTAAGISMRRRAYPQAALTLNLAHARTHDQTSTEFHTEEGPFTLVPLPGRRSSLVCVAAPAHCAD